MADPNLVALLDPNRDYGERTFEQVKEEIARGALVILPGERLPVLKDAETGRTVKGTGVVSLSGQSAQQVALGEFRRRALEDMPDAYHWLIEGMKSTPGKPGGDPRFHKIYWETLIGKMGENRGGEQIAEAFKAVVEAMSQPQERRMTFDA